MLDILKNTHGNESKLCVSYKRAVLAPHLCVLSICDSRVQRFGHEKRAQDVKLEWSNFLLSDTKSSTSGKAFWELPSLWLDVRELCVMLYAAS